MSRRGDERGSALVEFTLVVPVFLLVVIGAAALVWLAGTRSMVTGAARDGVRFATVALPASSCTTTDPAPCYPDDAAVEAYVEQRIGRDVDVDLVYGTETEVEPVDIVRNDIVTLKVTSTLENVFSTFSGLTGLGDFDYSSTAKARTE